MNFIETGTPMFWTRTQYPDSTLPNHPTILSNQPVNPLNQLAILSNQSANLPNQPAILSNQPARLLSKTKPNNLFKITLSNQQLNAIPMILVL